MVCLRENKSHCLKELQGPCPSLMLLDKPMSWVSFSPVLWRKLPSSEPMKPVAPITTILLPLHCSILIEWHPYLLFIAVTDVEENHYAVYCISCNKLVAVLSGCSSTSMVLWVAQWRHHNLESSSLSGLYRDDCLLVWRSFGLIFPV